MEVGVQTCASLSKVSSFFKRYADFWRFFKAKKQKF
jgi:hypothetical protein